MNYKVKAVIDNRTCENCKTRDGKIIDHLPGSYICTSDDGCRCTAIDTEELTPGQKHKPTHGGARPGAGRKSTGTGTTQPIYCGMLEDDLRADILKLSPQARKFALESMVQLMKVDSSWRLMGAFRLLRKCWENTNSGTAQTLAESSRNASLVNVEGNNE